MPDTHYTEWFLFTSEALPEDTFHVIRFSGTEGLNRLFSFTIELASLNADIDAEAMLNEPAAFTILREGDADPAVFKGYPSRVEQGRHFGDYTFYTVELRPAFWKLTKLVGSAVFVNEQLRDAAEEVLDSQQFFAFDHEFRLTRDYPAPEFAMQYGESLYDYILFRMEQQGVYYFFAPDGDRVIFADSPQSHEKAAATLAYSPASGLDHVRREEVLQNFTMARTPLPRQVVLRCCDWKDPNRVIVGQADVSANGMGDVYLAGENAESQDEAERLAQIRAEELICRGQVFTGSGTVPGLRPGLVFALENHYSASFNREYLITDITHEGAQEAYITLGLGIALNDGPDAPDHYFYRNGFSCIPSDVPYRPERTAPRAKISGVLRAFVDGAGNKRAETDEYGRYKLIFPFDLSGRKGGNASCWIRMAGPQAGRDSGMAFPLLPGTEVVVSFIDGDPDRPVITGSLPNGETGSISGPGNANFSGIRTTGGNQITFNDLDKQQGIALSTAAGLGYSIAGGCPDTSPSQAGAGPQVSSLGTAVEQTDMGLHAASMGGADISAAFKSVATSFQVMQAAVSTNKWYTWIHTFASALGGAGADVMNSLAADYSANGDKDTGEPLKWSSMAINAALPLITGASDILKAKDTPGSTYGVTLSAEKTKALSVLETSPSTSRMVSSITTWILARALATGAAAGTAHGDAAREATKAGGAYDEFAKNDTTRAIVTNIANDMTPEITAIITTIIGLKKQKKLGGVSISSPDNNVNIRGKEPVSVHSQTGILLDTSQAFDDAGAWGVPPLAGGHQGLDVWPADTDVQAPAADGKYVALNAAGALGLFAGNIQAVTPGTWASQAGTHLLKSASGDTPNAQVKMTDADKGIEAKVAADGKIVLTRGDAKPKLELSGDGGILANGANVQLTLTEDQAEMKAQGSGLTVKQNEGEFKGGTASVTCKNGEVDVNPGGGGTVKLGGMVSVKNGEINGQGVLQVGASMIKIG